jgi:DNA-binding beta-propeller fold protein YncE
VVEVGPNAPESEAVQAAASNGTYADSWRFDLGLRLAASELIPKQGKSAVIFITQGKLPRSAFEQYSPSQLLHYLTANGIRLYTVFVNQGAPVSEELEYLTKASGGRSYYLYRPKGVGGIVGDILAARDGTYLLEYTSEAPSNFGRTFIPVSAEVHLFGRSGRDESGYYAPLQF